MSTQHPSIVSSGPADDEPEPQRSVFDTYAFAIIQGALLAAAVSFERQAWSLFMKRPQGPTTGPAESRRQLEAVVLTAEGATFRAMHDAAKAGDIDTLKRAAWHQHEVASWAKANIKTWQP